MRKIIVSLFIALCANFVCAQGWVHVGCGLNYGTMVLYVDSLTNKLFVGGGFGGSNCQPDSFVAVWDGTTWDNSYAINGANYNPVEDIIRFQNELYVCGTIQYANGITINGFAKWHGSYWDSVDEAFHINNYGGPNRMYEYNNLLYCVGGDSPYVGNVNSPEIVAFDGVNWIPVGLPPNVISPFIKTCIAFQNRLYFAGSFLDSVLHHNFRLLSWDGVSWYEDYFYGGSIWDLAVYNNELYIGGDHLDLSGNLGYSIEKFDGVNYSSVGGGVSDIVYRMKVFDNKLFVVGVFDHVGVDHGNTGGIPASRIAVWDGTNWSAFSSDTFAHSTTVVDIAVYNNELYITGSIDQINTTTGYNSIAKYNGWYLGENDLKKKGGVEVYPNPAGTTLSIHLSTSIPITEARTFIITDVFGRVIYKETLKGIDTKIDVSKWSKGIYLLSLQNSNGILQKKIVVQ